MSIEVLLLLSCAIIGGVSADLWTLYVLRVRSLARYSSVGFVFGGSAYVWGTSAWAHWATARHTVLGGLNWMDTIWVFAAQHYLVLSAVLAVVSATLFHLLQTAAGAFRRFR